MNVFLDTNIFFNIWRKEVDTNGKQLWKGSLYRSGEEGFVYRQGEEGFCAGAGWDFEEGAMIKQYFHTAWQFFIYILYYQM